MTVYVDEIRRYPSGPWCHMWCDGNLDELHQMAHDIKLKREWFQDKDKRFPHYDLRPQRRDAALEKGAQQMSLKQWIANGFAAKGKPDFRDIQCPNCNQMARLIKVERMGSVYKCKSCHAVTVKTSDQPYTA